MPVRVGLPRHYVHLRFLIDFELRLELASTDQAQATIKAEMLASRPPATTLEITGTPDTTVSVA